MDVVSALRMNAGDGENSYARNSAVQSQIQSEAKRMVQEAIQEYCSIRGGDIKDCLRIADNTLAAVSEITAYVADVCQQHGCMPPECQLFLNDLPGNDFNSIFQIVQQEWIAGGSDAPACHCFLSGVPGSFYGRLFPERSIDFFHSSSSLHWLSQVPLELQSEEISNKGNIYIGKNSPPAVSEAYYNQFQSDFSTFLKMRAKEMVPGGRMVLIFMGRRGREPWDEEACFMVHLLSKVLQDMVHQGTIEERKLDTLNLPMYFPSAHEVMLEIEREASFSLKGLNVVSVDVTKHEPKDITIYSEEKSIFDEVITEAQNYAKCVRAVAESMIVAHFGEVTIEDLFMKYTDAVIQYFHIKRAKLISLAISLEKTTK